MLIFITYGLQSIYTLMLEYANSIFQHIPAYQANITF